LAARVPTLLVARRTLASGVGVVRGDDLVGIGLAVDHLVGLGHRSIAHVDGADAPGSADRRLGFDAAMARHGLGRHADVLTGGLTEAAGARAMTALLARPAPPSAVIAFNDRCATGVVDTLVHRGRRVPGDVSVVGYDDSAFMNCTDPPLTTVRQPIESMGKAAVALLVNQIENMAVYPEELLFEPELVVRGSTGRPGTGSVVGALPPFCTQSALVLE
jgi:LacI family transcriptional regulator